MNYEKLFSVNYFHEYYKSKVFRGFGVNAPGDTGRLMKAYGLLLREIDGGFTILYKEENNRPSELGKVRQPLKLKFLITSQDRAFLNYSQVPDTLQGYGYRLSNTAGNEENPLSLHKEKFMGDSDMVLFISSVADLTAKLPEDTGIKAEDDRGNVLFEGEKKELIDHQEELQEAGYVKVTAGEHIESYYFLPGNRQQIVGVIDITIDPSGGSHSLEAIAGSDYRATIDARPVFWRYNIINRDDYKYSEFKVWSGKTVLPTTEAAEKVMVTGEKAYFIETTSPIHLRERYDFVPELEMVKTESDRNIKKRINLPVPDINKVRVAREADAYRAYSEMYIYF